MKVVVFSLSLALLVLPILAKEVGKQTPDLLDTSPRNCASTGPSCKVSCDGLPDNSINQYCGNCTSYFVCMEGDRIFGHCHEGMYWDSEEVACVEQSKTCEECYFPPKCEATGPDCIHHCDGLADGDYQLCANCTSFATCTGGIKTTEECPPGTFWDDDDKGCTTDTNTCYECYEYGMCNATGPSCISDCTGLPDGNYQTCGNCMMYFTCTGGSLSYSLCPVGMFWDDDQQGCFQESNTCQHCTNPNECKTTGEVCKSRCYGEEDGVYQACSSCHSYISCSEGKTTYNECNPPEWMWDDDSKACLPSSSTCTSSKSHWWLKLFKY